MRVMLRGRRYTICIHPLVNDYAFCHGPFKKNPKIVINSKIKSSKLFLDSVIHEVAHACLWDIDEEAITTFATDLANVLMRLGVKLDVKKAKQHLIAKKRNDSP